MDVAQTIRAYGHDNDVFIALVFGEVLIPIYPRYKTSTKMYTAKRKICYQLHDATLNVFYKRAPSPGNKHNRKCRDKKQKSTYEVNAMLYRTPW